MLAIIGGTGLYQLPGLQTETHHPAATPFGDASAPVQQGRLGGQAVLFLPRHGAGHRLLPHEVNYRANVFALKRAGATMVLSVSACGSLTEELAPGHFALPHQYIDWTRGRRESQACQGQLQGCHQPRAIPAGKGRGGIRFVQLDRGTGRHTKRGNHPVQAFVHE